MMSSEISISLRLRGISHVLSCGCTSSTDAIGYAAALMRSGEADVILSGGADACVTPGMIFGFSRMHVVSTAYNDRPAEASRPFDRGRDGFVLGEGAWMVVLEREDRARARGAHDLRVDRRLRVDLRRLSPRADGAGRRGDRPRDRRWRSSDRAAHREEIGYVSYHGTSTLLNDAVESRCVRQVFGDHAERLAGSSVKSMIGHPQGASGAAGVVTAALAMSRGFLPPTINQRDPDPACDLDFIPNTGRAAGVEAALCNCLGFGSKNSALVIGRGSTCNRWHDVLIVGAGPAGRSRRRCSARAGRARAPRRSRDVPARQAVRRHAQSRDAGAAAAAGAGGRRRGARPARRRHARHRRARRRDRRPLSRRRLRPCDRPARSRLAAAAAGDRRRLSSSSRASACAALS